MNAATGKSAYGKLIAMAWLDPDFKARLIADPRAVMAEAGLVVPKGVKVTVIEDHEDTVHLVIPVKPSAKELGTEELGKLTWAYESNSGPSGGSRQASGV